MMKIETRYILVCAGLMVLAAGCENAVETQAGRYDLAMFRVENPSVVKLLGTDSIPVRAKSFDVVEGTYPTLQFEEVVESAAQSALYKQIRLFSKVDPKDVQVQTKGNLLHTHTGSMIHWVNKASGAYSFNDTQDAMSEKTSIKDHKEAVQLALKHIERLALLKLESKETLDIVSVSQVMNALVEDSEDEPFLTYGSDYYVIFGRRYSGLPVIGSYLQMRIGKQGELLGVQRTWRRITGAVNTKISINEPMQERLTKNHLVEIGIAKNVKDLDQIEIVSRACGYFEGPVNNRQKTSALGCLVNYKHRDDEMIASTVFPLEKYGFPLLGQVLKPNFKKLERQGQKAMTDDTITKDEGSLDEFN